MRRATTLLLALATLPLLGAERPPGLGEVVEIRHWSYPDYTRVVVELSRPVETSVRHLGPDASAERPERLYLDVPGIWVGRRYLDGVPVGDGLLRAVRLGQNTLTTTRVVIDVENYQRHRLLTLSHPDRLVVDVYGTRPGETATPTPAPLAGGLRSIRRVVIDAGHGGKDPGAIGVGGLREKDVTLRTSQALGGSLENLGFDVVYTRRGDQTIGLEERTAIAEAARGDVFISIHANAARRRSVHGIETYYLDHNHERHSVHVAARENGIHPSQVNALQRILAQLHIQEEVGPESRQLANLVHHEIVRGLPSRYSPVRDLGVKKGPFYVLFLSDMPAVLVEVGFLTHRNEARRLRDSDYLDAVAQRIAVAVARYRDGRSSVALRGLR